MTATTEEIDLIEAEFEDARSRATEAKMQLKAEEEDVRTAYLRLMKAAWGVDVGVVVVSDGIKCLVCEVECGSREAFPLIMAFPEKKDGEFSKKKRWIGGNWSLLA